MKRIVALALRREFIDGAVAPGSPAPSTSGMSAGAPRTRARPFSSRTARTRFGVGRGALDVIAGPWTPFGPTVVEELPAELRAGGAPGVLDADLAGDLRALRAGPLHH